MDRTDVPFNIRLLNLTPGKLQGLRPVRVTDIFDAQRNFHPDGLFSTLIFGRSGDELRSQRFSFIDIKLPILHPVIYRALVDLKRLYGGLISGAEYAVWNPDSKDFDKSNAVHGQTGYAFFLRYWKQIEYGETRSDRRLQNIKLVKQSYEVALTTKIIVMPAGLRDVEMDGGRVQMDDINGFYQKFLRIANTLSESAVGQNPETLNVARFNLQINFNQLYDYIEAMVKGKKKLLLSGWASRSIFNGTRNVITAMQTSTTQLGGAGNPDFNTTIIGLYQAAKGAAPVSVFALKRGFLASVFPGVNQPAKLVNKKTLHAEEVNLKPAYFDRFQTDEGLEKVLTAYGVEDVRHKPIEIEGHWLGLIYKGGQAWRFMQDIRELPEGLDPQDVKPLTFTELLYLSIYRDVNGLPAFVTRYPVTGVGSIYPSKTLIQPTIQTEVRYALGPNWERLSDAQTAYHFPVEGSSFVNSTVPHSSKLMGLGADFDGDMCSVNITYSDESRKEVAEFFTKKRAYVGTNGMFLASFAISTIDLVFHNMTSPVKTAA